MRRPSRKIILPEAVGSARSWLPFEPTAPMIVRMFDTLHSLRANAPIAVCRAAPVLGIDPGLRRTGYAFVSTDNPTARVRLLEAGLIRLNPRQPLEERLVELEAGLSELLTAHQPTVLACEQLYAHYKHPRTAILMGHARGVVLALAARRKMRVVHVAATHVKKYVTGRGHAGKSQMQRAVAAALGLRVLPEPHDVADAIAIALCGRAMEYQKSGDGRPG